jgi:putative flippase GtrA
MTILAPAERGGTPVPGGAGESRTALIEIVIPVYNEERELAGCVQVLHTYLREHFPFPATITIADNASTDETPRVAQALSEALSGVRVLRLEGKGRGRALRAAWSASDADVVAYLDVDLSTGLDALLPLVAPLVNGHSDLAIGSRLAPGARTVRGTKRELISRGYNALVQLCHGASFSDAQCGFKAARTEVIRPLLAATTDNGWFFDTELLLMAEHNGLRIHEVPVDWVEDLDSRVALAATAWEDLRGLVRVARAKARGTAVVSGLPLRPQPCAAHPNAVLAAHPRPSLSWQVISFAGIGLLSTLTTAVLYAIGRQWWSSLAANLVALTVSTALNTEANRRFTFTRSGRGLLRVHAQSALVFLGYCAVTSLALLALPALVATPSRGLEVAVLLGASALGTVARFLLLRGWVVATRPHREDTR